MVELQVEAAVARISFLVAWRRGSAVGALSSGALLVSGWLGTGGPLTGLGIALWLLMSSEIALVCFVRRCALTPELAEIPAVARRRARLCSGRRRRALGAALRATALPSSRARYNDFVLWDRVPLVRDELLALADELESAETVEPRTMLDVNELLCNGVDSPLLNKRVPAAALVSVVRCIRFRLLTAPLQRAIEGPEVAPAAGVAASADDPRLTTAEHARAREKTGSVREP